MHARLRRLAATFIAGLLAALPLAATLLVLGWALRLAIAWLGPQSLVGGVLARLGLRVADSAPAGYAIGLALVALAILGLGWLAEAGLQRGLNAVIESVVQRIPVVRNVYDTIERFVAMLSRRDRSGLPPMRPVWCHFGGLGGAAVLGLSSSPEPVRIAGRSFRAVLVPTAPIPIGGALVYVPEEWVTPAEVGIEGLTSIYVSMGVTSPQYLSAGR